MPTMPVDRPSLKVWRQNMVLMEMSVFPLGADESVSPFVARCLEIIDQSGLDCRTSAFPG